MGLYCNIEQIVSALGSVHPISPEVAQRLVAWTEALDKWSRVQRLVGWRSGRDLLSEGVADAWAAVPLVAATADSVPILDVGSGSGLPGLVFAAALPGREIHLVENRRKRAAFLRAAVRQMELGSVTVHHRSVQDLRESGSGPSSPLLAARAFAPPAEVIAEAARWNASGCLLSVARSPTMVPGWSIVERAEGRPAERRTHLLLWPDPVSD